MPRSNPAPSNDDWFPLDPAEHARQVKAILALLGRRCAHVLDLGIGDGRTAVPLTDRGHHVVGIDHDRRAVAMCKKKGIECILGDFAKTGAQGGTLWRRVARIGPFDGAVCVGNTFLMVASPTAAVELLGRLSTCLKPGAPLVLDDFAPLWREVAEGYWQEGVSEDGTQQLIWAPGDNVLALRRGKSVKPGNWKVSRGDVKMRLWSLGELQLLATAAGWSVPATTPRGLTILCAPPAKQRLH